MLQQIATGWCFSHRGNVYCQIDGVAMGSPVGPTLDNFFLAQLESQVINTNLYFLPANYCGYVDDIFCAFDCLENTYKFFSFINNYIHI